LTRTSGAFERRQVFSVTPYFWDNPPMKKLFFLLFALGAAAVARAQAPLAESLNLDFEEVNSDGSPRHWGNVYIFVWGDSVVYDRQLIASSPGAHSGARALELRNAYNVTANRGIAGSATVDADSVFTAWGSFELVPITTAPTDLTFWYRYAPVGGDTASARVAIYDSSGYEIGAAQLLITAPAPTYTRAQVPIVYTSPGRGAFMNLNFSTFYTAETTGQRQPALCTWLQIDDVALGVPLATPRLTEVVSVQMFPNPATDVLHIRAASGAPALTQLDLFDARGQRVCTVLDPQQVSLTGLAPGVYFAHLRTSAGTVVTRRIVKQ
jgi:hypothetical protein